MKISVNGEDKTTEAATLAELLEAMGYSRAKVATALNGIFVPARRRGETQLSDSDEVEIVAPRQGG